MAVMTFFGVSSVQAEVLYNEATDSYTSTSEEDGMTNINISYSGGGYVFSALGINLGDSYTTTNAGSFDYDVKVSTNCSKQGKAKLSHSAI